MRLRKQDRIFVDRNKPIERERDDIRTRGIGKPTTVCAMHCYSKYIRCVWAFGVRDKIGYRIL